MAKGEGMTIKMVRVQTELGGGLEIGNALSKKTQLEFY